MPVATSTVPPAPAVQPQLTPAEIDAHVQKMFGKNPAEQPPAESVTPAATTAAEVPPPAVEPAVAAPAVVEEEASLTPHEKAMSALRVQLLGGPEAVPAAELVITPEVEAWATANKVPVEELKQLNGIPRLRAEAIAARTERENFTKTINGLPLHLQVALDKAARGESDWNTPLDESRGLDYSKPFKDQDGRKMLERFAPEVGVTKEEWDEANSDGGTPSTKGKVKAALLLAEREFNAGKTKYDGYFAEKQKAHQAFVELDTRSRTAAKANLLKTNPALEPLVGDLDAGLTHGGVLAFFFEADGSVKPDALEQFAFLKYRNELVAAPLAKSANRARNEATLDVLSRTVEKAPAKPSDVKPPPDKTPAQQAQEYVDKLMGRA